MATFTKAADFLEHLAEKVHNLGSDTLMIALSNTAPASETNNPLLAGNGVLANVTQVSYANYTDNLAVDRVLEGVTSAVTGSTYKLDANDITITASGGAIATFRYAYLYNDTPTSPADPIIGVWDNGSGITLSNGEQRTLALHANGILTLS